MSAPGVNVYVVCPTRPDTRQRRPPAPFRAPRAHPLIPRTVSPAQTRREKTSAGARSELLRLLALLVDRAYSAATASAAPATAASATASTASAATAAPATASAAAGGVPAGVGSRVPPAQPPPGLGTVTPEALVREALAVIRWVGVRWVACAVWRAG